MNVESIEQLSTQLRRLADGPVEAIDAERLGRAADLLEFGDRARRRLEQFADLANSGAVQAGGRELKRKIWGAFAEYDERR